MRSHRAGHDWAHTHNQSITLPTELSNLLSCFILFIAVAVVSVILWLIYLACYLFTQLECTFHEDRHLVGSYSLLHPITKNSGWHIVGAQYLLDKWVSECGSAECWGKLQSGQTLSLILLYKLASRKANCVNAERACKARQGLRSSWFSLEGHSLQVMTQSFLCIASWKRISCPSL